MSMDSIKFFTQLANPTFAQEFNLIGQGNRLHIASRGHSGSLSNRESNRTSGILGAAKLLAEVTGKPDMLVGLNPQQLAQIGKTLEALRNRMTANVGQLDDRGLLTHNLTIVNKNMKTAIRNVNKATGTSTLAKCGMVAAGALALAAGVFILPMARL